MCCLFEFIGGFYPAFFMNWLLRCLKYDSTLDLYY